MNCSDSDVGVASGLGVGGVVTLHDTRMPFVEIEPDDFERLPSVEVHGTVVHRGEGSQFVNRTDEPFGVVLDDLDLAGRAVPQTDRA